MKRLFLLFAFFGALSLGAAQAQSCCASKAGAAKTASTCSTSTEAAAKAASLDASIEKRVCEKSGSVSYVRKVSENGATTYQDVNYDAATGKFINVAPAANAGKAGCSPAASAASCGSGAKTTGGACCSQKAPAIKTSTTAVKTAPSASGSQK